MSGASGPAGYHRYGEVLKEVEALARRHRDRVGLEVFGQSAGGRKLVLLRLAAAGPIDPDQRPALFLGANASGITPAGTEAALAFAQRLATASDETILGLLRERTFYVAPLLNPDAHEALFEVPRRRRQGNDQRLDLDRDGLIGEDGPDDLDGDGRITMMRIPDPAGSKVPAEEDPRIMIDADPEKHQVGAYRVVVEGKDDDGDGRYNEDDGGGVWVDRNFANAFEPGPTSGYWPSFAPETKAIMDELLARRNVALAVVYGPANNLLAPPRSLGGAAAPETFKVPKRMAKGMGLDPDKEYTADELWAYAQHLPFVKRFHITKEQMVQYLGGGAATKPEDDDLALYATFGRRYKEMLEEAGLDPRRPAEQYQGGGLTPWLYYHDGIHALELDLWGVPKALAEEKAEEKEKRDDQPLTLARLETMSPDEFLALDTGVIQAFLEAQGVPPQFGADRVRAGVESGKMTPARMAAMIKQMGGGGAAQSGAKGTDSKGKKTSSGADLGRMKDLLAYVDRTDPAAFTPWTPVTLPDGTVVEVGGVDPFVALTPPREVLDKAIEVHNRLLLDLASEMGQVKVRSVDVTPLGKHVYRVRAVAGVDGRLGSHSKMGERTRSHLPLLMSIHGAGSFRLLGDLPQVRAERLAGYGGATLEGVWRVYGDPGTEVVIEVKTENAGRDRRVVRLGKED